jgi:hypothetical protein
VSEPGGTVDNPAENADEPERELVEFETSLAFRALVRVCATGSVLWVAGPTAVQVPPTVIVEQPWVHERTVVGNIASSSRLLIFRVVAVPWAIEYTPGE